MAGTRADSFQSSGCPLFAVWGPEDDFASGKADYQVRHDAERREDDQEGKDRSRFKPGLCLKDPHAETVLRADKDLLASAAG